MLKSVIQFPESTGLRVQMMRYIQGDANSLPEVIRKQYGHILSELFVHKGEVGYLTIDESPVDVGVAQRCSRAKHGRAIHTEVGVNPAMQCGWGSGWGGQYNVIVANDAKVLLANNMDNTCAIWNAEHRNTSLDGDIGDQAHLYPYVDATLLKAGEVYEIGVFTPHESLPVPASGMRQFLRIISGKLEGREAYFDRNPVMQM